MSRIGDDVLCLWISGVLREVIAMSWDSCCSLPGVLVGVVKRSETRDVFVLFELSGFGIDLFGFAGVCCVEVCVCVG